MKSIDDKRAALSKSSLFFKNKYLFTKIDHICFIIIAGCIALMTVILDTP